MPFTSLGVSNSRFTPQGITHIVVKTPALSGRGEITVYLPPGHENDADLPMAILLHGIYATHWTWTMGIGAHITLQAMIESGEAAPMGLVMPSDGLWGDGTGYIPHAHANYEMWIVNDVPEAVIQVISPFTRDSRRFIAGLSMGGFGAMRLGAKYPHLYAGISAHSAVTDLVQLAPVITPPIKTDYVNDTDRGAGLYWLVENRAVIPPFRFDCGREDIDYIEENRQLHEALMYYEVPHTYEEFDGAHDATYWGEHIADTFRFFSQILRK